MHGRSTHIRMRDVAKDEKVKLVHCGTQIRLQT